MTRSILWKLAGVTTLLLTSLCACAQVKMTDSIQFDVLEKIVGVAFTLGGIFLGFMQLKMANKMAEMEAKFNAIISNVRDEFNRKIETETEKLECQIKITSQEIEKKMATRHDVDNLKTIIRLEGEVTKLTSKLISDQLTKLNDK
jgi:hypothetical protein